MSILPQEVEFEGLIFPVLVEAPTLGNLALAVPLDPVENNCYQRAHNATKQRGYYHRQYQAHAYSSRWGTERSGCGSGVLVRFNDGDIQIVPVLCDRWSCKLCGPKRAAWLKREVQRARFRYKLNQFWTLTIDTKSCTAAQSFRLVKAAWHRLYMQLRKEYGPFGYLWVMETTKRGYAHLHLLTDLELTAGELSRRWKVASRGSYIVDAESVNSERASDYLTKYCMEQATVEGRPARARFFGRSRGVAFDPFRPEVDTELAWYHWRMPYKDAVEYLGDLGPMRAEVVTGTPYAAVRSRDGLDIEAICAAISAQVIDQAAEDAAYWAEPSGDDLIEVEA